MILKVPTDQIQAAARVMYLQHYNETGELLPIDTAEISLGQWPDGTYYLHLSFEGGHWWELAFGPEADAILAAASATRH